MVTFIVIGAPGSGKSPYIHNLIKGRRCWVFDVQNEYGGRTKYQGQTPLGLSDNPNADRARYIPNRTSLTLKDDVTKFIQMCISKRDTICVFEESTVYLEGKQEEAIKKLIVNRLHTGNSYVFVFHSIAAVPPRIMQMCNYVILHKTLDEDHVVKFKYGRLFHHFLDLQDKPYGQRKEIRLI